MNNNLWRRITLKTKSKVKCKVCDSWDTSEKNIFCRVCGNQLGKEVEKPSWNDVWLK